MSVVSGCRSGKEAGSAIVEYDLLLVLIALACVLTLEILGGAADDSLSRAASSVVTS